MVLFFIDAVNGALDQKAVLGAAKVKGQVAFTDRDEGGKVDLLGANSEVIQHLDYYPFGMTQDMPDLYPAESNDNRYRYNGKEFSEELGLYDYGARWYDPAIARWNAVDPVADFAPNWTPYRYGFNNPISFHDPTGMFEIDEETAKNHPELVEFLKGLVNFWNSQSDEFKNEYMEKSGLNNEEVVDMLTYGSGPKLVVEDIDLKDEDTGEVTRRRNGLTGSVRDKDGGKRNANNGKGLVKIDDDVVEIFKGGEKHPEDVSKFSDRLLEATVFHEGAHFGNYKKNRSGNGKFEEAGQAFEVAIYGGKPTRRNTLTRMRNALKVVSPLPVNKIKSVER